jgi:ubiquinone/menaquinone biosynthesis C-methylase UbiE
MHAMNWYDPGEISKQFDEFGEKEWERLVATPVDEVSLHLHTHYLTRFIKPGWRVLEIGAGPGRFTQILAVLGAKIVVADISPGQIEINRKLSNRLGFDQAVEQWCIADICQMPEFSSDEFDCVVAYGGPLSYVLERRQQALVECCRVLHPGGILLLSVMSLWGTIHRHLSAILQISPQINQGITASGDLTSATLPGRKNNFMHMFRPSELRELIESARMEILAMSASNCLSTNWHEVLELVRKDPVLWEELLRMEVEASAEPESHNLGTHMIAVARKPG